MLSANGPAETQNRGAMHIHVVVTVIVAITLERLRQLALDEVEEWMRAALHFVQGRRD